MTDKPENVDGSGETSENKPEEQGQYSKDNRKISFKVLLVGIISFVILLFFIGGWFVYKHFSAYPEEDKKTSQVDEGKESTPESNCFISIPEVVVNLRSAKPKGNILRATFILQLYGKEDEPKIKEFIPIILDQVLSYLRDQSVNDLEGPGLERMRQAILLRINNIVRPLKIHRVILKDFIIQ